MLQPWQTRLFMWTLFGLISWQYRHKAVFVYCRYKSQIMPFFYWTLQEWKALGKNLRANDSVVTGYFHGFYKTKNQFNPVSYLKSLQSHQIFKLFFHKSSAKKKVTLSFLMYCLTLKVKNIKVFVVGSSPDPPQQQQYH